MLSERPTASQGEHRLVRASCARALVRQGNRRDAPGETGVRPVVPLARTSAFARPRVWSLSTAFVERRSEEKAQCIATNVIRAMPG
ncbi:hypothetical protein trd_A0093 (plasmid) [Thermomicrobium roseum DSM 5159]|uniref:Uncharacterized protein n=1 Tax=Thermomicrobium roseum (strain ATCC 27502 / DSM 5159 / P-2) TaxID=309801 RepID=B9L5G6_THERP|nr:hypothetical protein trd_A0093 [Thermomicrobium roseum DSM 5159]